MRTVRPRSDLGRARGENRQRRQRSTRPAQPRAGRFDLLLTDVRMPIMDGIALALASARDYPDLTILLMTGYADQRERAYGLEALIHDVIAKPFTLTLLRDAVKEALAVKLRA